MDVRAIRYRYLRGTAAAVPWIPFASDSSPVEISRWLWETVEMMTSPDPDGRRWESSLLIEMSDGSTRRIDASAPRWAS